MPLAHSKETVLLLLTTSILFSSCGGPYVVLGEPTNPSTPPGQVTHTNVLTAHNDEARTGQNLTENILTQAKVNSTSFGKVALVPLDGRADAQPLYVSQLSLADGTTHSVVYAATEHDSVYALEASTGAILWRVSVLGAGETPSDDRGCGQVTPEIGITATPVIDLSAGAHGTIYLEAMSKDRNGNYHHRLHALDITTGAEEFGGPAEVAAAYPGTGDNSVNGQVIFDPKQYKSRPGLLLLNGVVYIGWGSHCDFRPYTGWLTGYDRSTLRQVNVFNFAPNGSGAALWNSGAGLAANTSTGEIFASVSNGTFDLALDDRGFPSTSDFGNCFVKLSTTNAGGRIVPEDFWTMSDTTAESSSDEDLGSGGVLLLPDLKNSTGQTVQLGTGAGKDSQLYVFDRANLGKFNFQNNTGIYQQLSNSLGGPVFSSPAWFNGTVYYGAVTDRIRGFNVSAALLQSPAAGATDTFFVYPGATPSISANGLSDPILWAVENTNPAVLHAYNATNLTVELYNSKQAGSERDSFGPGNKYIIPTIADGRVFVGTTDSLAIFGLIK